MFDDLIKQKPYKKKKRYYTCISCDRVLRKGQFCPVCNPKKPKQMKLWDDRDTEDGL